MTVPGPYSGTSSLALILSIYALVAPIIALFKVARVSALTLGLVYGYTKLSYLKGKAKSHTKAEAKGHH